MIFCARIWTWLSIHTSLMWIKAPVVRLLFTYTKVQIPQTTKCTMKIFLKGSKQKKEQLQHENSSMFEHFRAIWEVRSNHLVQGYPQQYIYYLLACFKPGCSHGLCQKLTGSSRSCLLYTSPSPRDATLSRMPSSA